MRLRTTMTGLIGGLALLAGTPASASDEQAAPEQAEQGSSGSEEQVEVTVKMPNGRTIILRERRQPSRVTTAAPGSTRVARTLPDGSRISYGTGRGNSGQQAARRGSRRGSGAQTGSNATARPSSAPVPTLGTAIHSEDGATGGQDVRFQESGISAIVVGRTVYIWGADLVQSTEAFDVVEGERMLFDGAIATRREVEQSEARDQSRLFAPIKLEYEADTEVTLTMYSQADNPDEPDRAEQSWTFRVR